MGFNEGKSIKIKLNIVIIFFLIINLCAFIILLKKLTTNSIITTFHYSIIPLLHYSTTPLFQRLKEVRMDIPLFCYSIIPLKDCFLHFPFIYLPLLNRLVTKYIIYIFAEKQAIIVCFYSYYTTY